MKQINKFVHPDATLIEIFKFNNGYECPLFEIKSIHGLNQCIGYAKYINNDYKIFYRGQRKLYSSIIPSLYRSCDTDTAVQRRNQSIGKYLQEYKTYLPIFKDLDNKVIEPLIQHYGIKTRWIDLVDNVWIALVFTLLEYKTNGSFSNRYEYVSRRNDNDDYGYLFLISTDALESNNKIMGLYSGKTTDIVDLRMAAPSIFTRPNSQHALLMRKKNVNTLNDIDYADKTCAIIKMKVSDIKNWIGNGKLVSVENIYPPPIYDFGYSLLLDNIPRVKIREDTYGSISLMSYSM